MDKDKLKLIVRNLELLVDSLKAEIYSDVKSYSNFDKTKELLKDYDEIFEDDDGYPDWQSKKVYEVTSKTDKERTSL